MLATLLAWLYVTFLCWTWGILFLHLIKRVTKNELVLPHFCIVCISGLSVITIIAGLLSLFIPLGKWWVQFLFIIPALAAFFIRDTPYFFSSLKKEFSRLHIASVMALSLLLVLILVMSSWIIVHPDTLGYHAQTMQWIEKYKVVPGLVHLHVRFGYQGLWFVDCALFDFSFTGNQGITYLNSTVLFWFLLFIVNRIDHNFFKEGKRIYGLLWTGLLSLSLWSYTQVRLTTTSASPDFIATIFVLLIVYLLIEKETKHLYAGEWLLVGALSIIAVTIKLSVAPILLIAFVAALLFLNGKKIRAFILFILIGLFTISAFVTRNIITSGHVVFPSNAIDIVNVDWKYSNGHTMNEKNYITAYAKKQSITTREDIDTVNKMSIPEWLPGWWKSRSFADKTLLILFLLSLLTTFIVIGKIIRAGFPTLLSLIAVLAGLLFWFINAPDPRFGFGFIIGLMAIAAYTFLKDKEILIGKKIRVAMLIILSILTLSYTIYRIKNFFGTEQLITPLGIPVTEYKTFDCEGIRINSPIDSEFGEIPVPCTDLNCENLGLRGKNIQDGFRSK